MSYLVLFLTLISPTVFAAGGSRHPPLEVVSQKVDLDRYLGKWFEIARLPFSRQEGCFGTTATYSKRPDGRIKVLNECHDKAFVGELRSAEGIAQVVDPSTNAKLEVSFFRPFWGDYWILALDENYQHVLIGQPSREYLWILSRTPKLSPETLESLKSVAVARGYDLTLLETTPQKDQ